ncbi:MAG TPA: gas vesicle protein GvpD basic region 2 domain-containing protein [Thermoplasmata archaeon]|nr:gas vesicle protein GvpD basic region 2 domain-containing protein [Thermoplasmata archaeon]
MYRLSRDRNRKMERRYRQRIGSSQGLSLRTTSHHPLSMPERRKLARMSDGWEPVIDPVGRFSTGIPDFDRLLGGGFKRGSLALFTMDESVGLEDLDLLLFPTYLNFLYQSRGILAVLPSRDSPHDFRERLTRFATRRRFDTRVRVVDYIGEDHGLSYVVNLADAEANPLQKKAAIAKMVAAERQVQGIRKHPFIELHAFEVFDTLMGSAKALKMWYYGVKRARHMGNLVVGLLGPGLVSAAGVRRMADAEFALHRDEVGLLVHGVRPSFSSFVVTEDGAAGRPHIAFVPRPAQFGAGR